MIEITVINPSTLSATGQNTSTLSEFDLQFLAQGDSWFSIGSVPPWNTTNLFNGMSTSRIAACAVNCAYPGETLRLMVETTRDSRFLSFLNGRLSQNWAGILLSAGGNDLVQAVHVDPSADIAQRLLLVKPEWGTTGGGEKYLSNRGWQTFVDHITQVFAELIAARDAGVNKGIPIVWHSYDVPTPRNAPAGLGLGPWLYPAMLSYEIPEDDWIALAQVMLDRLETLLDHIAATTQDGSVHVIHGEGTLQPAKTTDTGPTNDWENEIHPTSAGYRKLSALWQPVLTSVFESRINVVATPLVAAAPPAPPATPVAPGARTRRARRKHAAAT